MLQWMGGSRRKLTASKRSTHNRQKQYFEQRKRQQQTSGLENNTDEKSKQTYCNEEPRSLDVLSLMNLATTGRQDHSRHKLGSEVGPVCSSKASPPLEPQDVPVARKVDGKVEGLKKSASHNEFSSKSADTEHKRQKPNDLNDVSLLDLLGDDVPKCISEGKSNHEAHVAFSVEGLGRVGSKTPIHSPILHGRDAPSTPKVSKWTRHTEHRKSDIPLDLNATLNDIKVTDDVSNGELIYSSRGVSSHMSNTRGTNFMVSCASPDACEIGNYDDKDIFHDYSECHGEKPWNTRFGISGENFNVESNYDSERKSRPRPREDHPYFLSEVSKSKAYGSGFGYPLSPSIRSSFKAHKKSGGSVSYTPCVKPRRPDRDYESVSFDWKDNESSDFASMFTQPAWSLLETEGSPDSMSLLSEESCSSTAEWEGRNYGFGSRVVESKERKIHPRDGHHISSERKFGKLSAAETRYSDIDEDPWEESLAGRGNYDSMTSQWSSKAYSSEYLRMFEPDDIPFNREDYSSSKVDSAPSSLRTSRPIDTKFFGCILVQEDNIYDMFPATKQYPKADFMNQRSALKFLDNYGSSEEFIFETDIVEGMPDPGVLLPRTNTRPLETESHFPCMYGAGGSQFQKDTQFPDLSRPHKVCIDNMDPCSMFEMPQTEDSTEKKSLSSANSGTAVAANCKGHSVKHKESNGENQEQFDGPEKRDSPSEAEESPMATAEISIQNVVSVEDKLDQCIDSSPGPYQTKNKEAMKENMEPEKPFLNKGGGSKDVSYQVMLESYVLQLLCVQKVLLDASDIKKSV